jgi:hypothetical protein
MPERQTKQEAIAAAASVRPWTRAEDRLPPDGVLVETISEGGMPSTLKRSGNLWFVPDGEMYVYYGVRYWREIS